MTETIRNEMRGRREPLEEFSFKTQGHAIETVKADDCQSELSIFLSGLPVEEKQHYRKENWKLAEQGKERSHNSNERYSRLLRSGLNPKPGSWDLDLAPDAVLV